MRIIYEDAQLLVCHKPAGLATQTGRLGEKDAVSELKNYLQGTYLGLVHRLDQPVEGLLVFAKTPETAKELSRQISSHEMQKIYMALVCGEPAKNSTVLVDYLMKDSKTNTSKIADKGHKDAKRAELTYHILKQGVGLALIQIELNTGRHHQIRVQMSNAGYPLLGDFKYGSGISAEMSRALGIRQPALCACELSFLHPATKEGMRFRTEPEGAWKDAV